MGDETVHRLHDDDQHVQPDGERERAALAFLRRVMVVMAVAAVVMRVALRVLLVRVAVTLRMLFMRISVIVLILMMMVHANAYSFTRCPV